jgi:hypothetical protein
VIGIFGEGAFQQFIRVNYLTGIHDQLLVKRHLNQHAQARPVEAADIGSHPEANIRHREYTTTKNVLEDDQLVVERYDQEGKLIRITPPGYLPIDKMI